MAEILFDENSDWTIQQYCVHKGFTVTTFYNLEKRGLTPEVTRYPGTRVVRISAAARRAHEARMKKLARTQDAKREAKRRRAQTKAAGKLAAESSLHFSKRGKSAA